ncbi:MAG: septum formation inhibitor Maf [Gammaproteobacteria bacterium]|nr:septum formation inhibitor Maf [Gammaproteobacteria bacterium]
MKLQQTILLASASPRRRELLRQLAVTFKVEAADIDESIMDGETPREHVLRLSREKALAGFSQCGGAMPTLGSDTIVLLDDEILGKPGSRAEAESMLKHLSGNTHHVYSAVALVLKPDKVMETLNITAVTFGDMPDSWIRQYCQSNEPMDKAGAYAVQGGTGQYIRRIEGSYSGVMGLPLYETAELLRRAGLLV